MMLLAVREIAFRTSVSDLHCFNEDDDGDDEGVEVDVDVENQDGIYRRAQKNQQYKSKKKKTRS